MPDTTNPDTPSIDCQAMKPYLDLVSDLMNGTAAMRAAGEKYLPRFARESIEAYEYRRRTAKYVGIFRDIVETLAAKPFDRKVSVIESTASPEIRAIAEDVDGAGSTLHGFAAGTFFAGINDAVSWILVDFPAVPAGLTVAEEKARLARPYWVRIAARNMLDVRSEMDGAKEIFTHARILETQVVREGYSEKTVRRVRILNRDKRDDGSWARATWEVLEERMVNSISTWVQIGAGDFSVGVITLVPFITGRRKGASWQLVPPMQDAANLQVEHYQAESALKSIKDQVAFPMLSGNGVSPTVGPDGAPAPLTVGPRAVLYAPTNADGRTGSWAYVEPEGKSLQFLADDIKRVEQQLRELGRQPLTAQTGNLTVITTAFAASKANSVISAWALNLKDALETALMYTAWWLRQKGEPEVDVETEFDTFVDDSVGPTTLLEMRKAGDLSVTTLWRELKRRGVLAPEFDADQEIERILNEVPSGDGLDNVVPLPRAAR